ncbi:MAG TPA: dienelactone hydrolase family protein [Bacteroidota bacterium]|nr:dienelactone hydrolase family protein [Bacteroidota bacterium]
MRISLPVVLAICLLTAAPSEGRQSLTRVSYLSGSDTVTAVLACPTGPGPFPALILIHEWYGLTDWVRDNAKLFADSGYIALAIDLYRGRVAADPEEAHELMRGLPEDRAARDLAAAAGFLRDRKDVIGSRVGSVGWCMGGGYSLMAALRDPRLAGSVICYGRLVTDTTALRALAVPLLGLFGGDDRGITPKDVNNFSTLARSLGKSVETRIYPGAGHAFMNPTGKEAYRPAAAADAWTRIMAFFRQHLKDR